MPKTGGHRVPLVPNEIQNEYLDYTCYSPWLWPPSNQDIPLSPWANRAFSFRNLILKPRQVGMSTIVLARKVLRVVSEPNNNLLIIAQDDAMKDEFRARVHSYLEDLKAAGQCPPYGTAGLTDNKERLELKMGSNDKSIIYFQSAQSPNIGRTVTFRMAYGTEIAFWDLYGEGTARKIMHALNQSTPAPPYGEIDLESTPNGPSGAFFDLCMAAQEGKITDTGGGHAWKLHFWEWWKQSEYRSKAISVEKSSLSDHEKFLMLEHGVDLEQIAWRRMKVAEAESLKQHFEQEYPEDAMTCFITAQQTVLKKATIARLRAYAAAYEPLYTEYNGDLRVYEGPQPGMPYITTVDGSQGNPGDDQSAFIICRKDTMEPVVVYNGYIPPLELANIAVRYSWQYNQAYMAAEVNNDVGFAVNARIDEMRYPNVHYRQDPETDLRSGVRINPFKLGWRTDVKTKPEMVDILQQWADGGLVRIKDRVLVNQLATLIWRPPKGNPSGRKTAAAAPSAHDDVALSYMINLAVRDYATSVNIDGRRAEPVRL